MLQDLGIWRQIPKTGRWSGEAAGKPGPLDLLHIDFSIVTLCQLDVKKEEEK